ncbi:hypothetical protein EN828_28060 [Mesorhizobium sp. M2D.F.Ca.ET.185.01.1.1]|uniref:AbiJ-NTD4 domain-containing protein n=1 Tax=unclassified Mesorhizobium TaxID=325217 RepID=UPI000FCA9D2A|nr:MULTISPECIES: hypothetical protein [unclassified Mesorhizobium]TGP74250.1 hypothetical protein EN870_27710 [bacterium M00.F.Ca.ET.227.01.1.1]TGU04530.1 hypothetical protein EN806_39545 [bacterium M00.F.Ca.ET.163.01.1.1]TGU33871.1 hypothetical protein EN799_23215 [bacterium M00.F.Ca.ET.156.01.1.1]TGU43376.1 hypothetical protein EN789_28135 [bacterium M00.F.Ca.ET.146.01.1.1]TGW09047.1 hypothetical protein EN788_27635 [Mesorhizobium sp. M2D.F.Ca.ET.145.01.1.1]
MLFSQRYMRAIDQGRLVVEIPEAARRKLWSWLQANNSPLHLQRDPNDRWISQSSILDEVSSDLLVEHGWDRLPVLRTPSERPGELRLLVQEGAASWVFDTVELAARYMDAAEKEALRQKLNQIFELHDCPWRLSDGEFFKLDGDFIGARLAMTAHDALTANRFEGAGDEFAKARQYLGAGDVREAIFYSGHSFESVMKVLTGLDHANGDKLIKELAQQGFFDDLPEAVRNGFTDQVLKALPFLRNKLGGHGQGAAVVNIPPVYGDLAIQIAAAFHNFLISKHLERSTPPPPEPLREPAARELTEEIPF